MSTPEEDELVAARTLLRIALTNASAMLATLKLHIDEVDRGGRFIGYDYQDRMRANIKQAEEAGIPQEK